MTHDLIGPPESEESQIRELNRMVHVGSAALVGANGGRVRLADNVCRLLKEIVRNMQVGRAIALVPGNQQLTT